MKRTFVTAISLQPHNNLRKVFYEPQEFSLSGNRDTCYPIIPIINEFKGEDPDDVEIIAILPHTENAIKNYETFKEEIREINLDPEKIRLVEMGDKPDKRESVKLLLKLLDEIPEDSIVYADITYNTKPMSAMVVYAMEFIEKMKDTEVAGIYYGELARDYYGKVIGTYLYEITVFKQLSDVLQQLEILGVKDIRSALGRVLGE